MSRVGKKVIKIPEKTRVSFDHQVLQVEGQKGRLTRNIHPAVNLDVSEQEIHVNIQTQDKKTRALWGMTRSLVQNMVTGVSKGFEKVLEINGIGYRAELSGKQVIFSLGYSHPVAFDIPDGISVSIEKNTILKLSGIDREALGHMAASMRRLRPPEPYKGKGVKYAEERIIRKAGKTGTK